MRRHNSKHSNGPPSSLYMDDDSDKGRYGTENEFDMDIYMENPFYMMSGGMFNVGRIFSFMPDSDGLKAFFDLAFLFSHSMDR